VKNKVIVFNCRFNKMPILPFLLQKSDEKQECIIRLAVGNSGDVKPVGEGALELRISYGTG
jgi:hypothetical protein